MSPKRPCAEARCPNFAEPGMARCAEHESDRRRNLRERRKVNGFNYDSARWRRTSKRYRFRNPICERCGERLAEHVHHRNHYYGPNPYSFAGLEALCAPCHGHRHAEEAS